jgi:ABC-type Zn uptake system ZnuABC Zn-binding protein ZnuA
LLYFVNDILARSILAALQDTDPKNRGLYEANFREFVAEIDQLDAAWLLSPGCAFDTIQKRD